MEPKKYQDLHPEAQRLDRELFQTLESIVKGSLFTIISQLTGQYACYTKSFGIVTATNKAFAHLKAYQTI